MKDWIKKVWQHFKNSVLISAKYTALGGIGFVFYMLFIRPILLGFPNTFVDFFVLDYWIVFLVISGYSFLITILPALSFGIILDYFSKRDINIKIFSLWKSILRGFLAGLFSILMIFFFFFLVYFKLIQRMRFIELIDIAGISILISAAICGALAGREIHRRNLERLAAGQEEAGE